MAKEKQKIPPGYKQTEIGVIPEDWEVKRLDELFAISAGQDLIADSFSNIKNEQHPFPIYSNSLDNYGLYGYTRISRHDGNGITITARGTIGKANARDHKFDAIGRLLVLNPKKELNCFFISEYINNRVIFFIENTSVPQLTAPQASQYLVAYPNPEEQNIIASVLSDADTLISKLEALIQKKKLIKQGAMQELLAGKRRLPGFSGKWETKKLGDIADVIGGGTPSTIIAKYWNGSINWFTPTEIGFEKYACQSKRKITDEGLKNSSAKILNEGTILLTSRAGIGDLAILKSKACTNQGFQSLAPKNVTDSEFLYYLMLTKKNDLLDKASGSTFLEISPNNVLSILVQFPKISEQTAIANILSDMDAEIEKLESQLAKYQSIKQGMMQTLLTGRIRLV